MPATPHHVLVIDDDAVMRELLLLLFSMEGHTVHTAGSGEDALAMLAVLMTAPTVVLADLQMPGLSGAPLAAELRHALPLALLFAMSASAPTAAEAAAYTAVLNKPFTAADFHAALAAHRVVDAETPSSSAETVVLNHDIYAKLSATMPAAQLRQLYEMCLGDAEKRIAAMRLAADAADAGAFTREAHAVKGGCGMLGATELYTLAAQMEKGALLCTSLLNDFPPAIGRLRRMLDAPGEPS